MDNQRLFIILALAAVSFLLYESWMQDYGRPNRPVADSQVATQTQGDLPTSSATPVMAGVPDVATTTADVPAAGTGMSEALQPIRVETDLLRLDISPHGGTIQRAWLSDYPVSPEDPDTKFELLQSSPNGLFIAQSGLLGEQAGRLPTHEAVFTASATQYRLRDDADHLDVVLSWTDDAGVEVKKIYTFRRGSYVIDVRQVVVNGTADALVAREYDQLQRTDFSDPNDPRFVRTYTGGVYYTPADKYKKVSFKDMTQARLDVKASGGWVSMMQHYFMAAWIPPAEQQGQFYSNVLGGSRYIIGKYSPAVRIAPDATHTFDNRLFIGPKLQSMLSEISPGLELAVDYGWLTVIAKPIFWMLSAIHSVIGNWGWAIIMMTILIKAAFYKLSETSYKSMANMRKFTPRMQALKDRYGDDKQRLNQAMMELYKTEKINPLSGCLPILVQIPVFISLYWVLLDSVELRNAPFALWLNNLSEPDPYFILPLVMGVSMFVQQKLNPAPPDPLQAKIMMALPFVFTVFFAFFPAGLVLYWTVNNLLSIAQQWHITHNLEKADAKQKR